MTLVQNEYYNGGLDVHSPSSATFIVSVFFSADSSQRVATNIQIQKNGKNIHGGQIISNVCSYVRFYSASSGTVDSSGKRLLVSLNFRDTLSVFMNKSFSQPNSTQLLILSFATLGPVVKTCCLGQRRHYFQP